VTGKSLLNSSSFLPIKAVAVDADRNEQVGRPVRRKLPYYRKKYSYHRIIFVDTLLNAIHKDRDVH
jgi:hypothetical protein